MAHNFIRTLGVVFLVAGLSAPGFAGTMKGWVKSAYGQIGSPLIDTLGIYRSDGFLLIDVAANYAAFSFRGERLTKSQREKIGSVEATAGLVVSYQSCAPQTGWLNGDISQITVKNQIKDAARLAEELRELVEFSEENKFKPWGYGASKSRQDQVFMGWNDKNKNSIEIQINKETHQLVWQVVKACPKK